MRFEFGVVPYVHYGVRRYKDRRWETASDWYINREDLEPAIAEMQKAGAVYKIVKRTSFYETIREMNEGERAEKLAAAEEENQRLRKFVALLLGSDDEEETEVSEDGRKTGAGEGDN